MTNPPKSARYQAAPAYRTRASRHRGRGQLHRPRDARHRQPADPAGSRAVDRGYGPAALGLPLGLCLLAAAGRRAGRPARAAPHADAQPRPMVARADARRLGQQLRPVLRRAGVARHRRGAAIPDQRPRGARLVQRARTRSRDRDLELLLDARHGDLGAAADLPDAGLQLALDVRDHGRRRPLVAAAFFILHRDPRAGGADLRGGCVSDRMPRVARSPRR